MGKVRDLLGRDHDRIDALLARVVTPEGREDLPAYDAFRGALLRHIGIEEKILAPGPRRRDERTEKVVARLRADHARLAVLLTKRPTLALVAEIREVLEPHNAVEEGDEGFYAVCEESLGDEDAVGLLLARIEAAPPVVLRPLPGPGERPRPRRISPR